MVEMMREVTPEVSQEVTRIVEVPVTVKLTLAPGYTFNPSLIQAIHRPRHHPLYRFCPIGLQQ